METGLYSGDSTMWPGYAYVGKRVIKGDGYTSVMYQWRKPLQEPQQIPQKDNHWNDVNVWSAGMPDGITDTKVLASGSIILPSTNETAAVGRR